MHKSSVWPAMLVLLLSVCIVAPKFEPKAHPVLQKYGSMPKGLTLEGVATGFDEITKVDYDKDRNKFVINGVDSYENPIPRDEFIELYRTLTQDDRLGCSISNDKPIYFGKIDAKTTMARKILETDKFLGGVAFAKMERLKGYNLPQNYVPKAPQNRTISTVCMFNLTGFAFQKGNGFYRRVHCNMEVTLYPVSTKKAADGGHLPDEEALQQDRFEPEDKANRNHLQINEQEYLKMPIIAQSAVYGEAASFIRLLRDNGFKMEPLLAQMR